MPLYEYHCDACGQDFEVQQRMSDPPVEECSCGEKGKVRRLLSAGNGLIFKGSGFYITDYKNGSSSSSSSNGSSESSSSSKSSSEGSSSAAPATSSSGGHSCGSGCGCGS